MNQSGKRIKTENAAAGNRREIEKGGKDEAAPGFAIPRRARLFAINEDLVKWENSTKEKVLARAGRDPSVLPGKPDEGRIRAANWH